MASSTGGVKDETRHSYPGLPDRSLRVEDRTYAYDGPQSVF